MTIEQITAVLSKFNYELDSWIPFNEVSLILLDQDGRIYIDKKTKRFNFGSDSILRICDGNEQSDRSFLDERGNDNTTGKEYNINGFVDFKKIFGFIRTTEILNPLIYTKKIIK